MPHNLASLSADGEALSLSLSAELDWLFRFRDPLLREEFRTFNRSRGLSRFFVLVFVVANVGLGPLALYLFFCAVLAPQPLQSWAYQANVALSLVVVLLVAALEAVIWAIVTRHAQRMPRPLCRCVTLCHNFLHSLSPSLFPAFAPTADISGNRQSLSRESADNKSLSLSVSNRLSQHRVAPLPQNHAAPSSSSAKNALSSAALFPSPFVASPSPKTSSKREKRALRLPPPLSLLPSSQRMPSTVTVAVTDEPRAPSQRSTNIASKASAKQKKTYTTPTPATTPTAASSKTGRNASAKTVRGNLSLRERIDFNTLFVALAQILYLMFFVSHALFIDCPSSSSSSSSSLSGAAFSFFSHTHIHTLTPTLIPTYAPTYASIYTPESTFTHAHTQKDVNYLDWTELGKDPAGLKSIVLPQSVPLCENAENYLLFHSLVLLLLPCLFIVSLPDLSVGAVWTTLALTLFVIVSVIVYLATHTVWLVLGLYVCFTVCIVIDLQMSRVSSFRIYRKLSAILDEKERNAEANHVAEMRHMIANVAHDLKTPLASFMTGLDIIEMSISDFRRDLDSNFAENSEKNGSSRTNITAPSSIKRALFHKQEHVALDSIFSCLANIRNTHAFMMMTINRCLDYAKASRGLRLVPRYEPLSLREALELPLQCVRSLQSRISVCVHWDALPPTVCTHIISDKQWLQENLLCLLSNAVKYSAEGQVDVSVFLEEVSVDESDEEEIEEEDDDDDSERREAIEKGEAELNRRESDCERESERVVEQERDEENVVDNNSIERAHLSPQESDDELDGNHHKKNKTKIKIRKHTQFANNNNNNNSNNASSNDEYANKKKDCVQFLRFEVQDTGIGMSEEEMLSLFNPFKQTQRLAGGTGLGLYSLAKRVEALRGRYGVQRRRDGGQGSLFWLSIPYKPDGVFAEHQQSSRNVCAYHGSVYVDTSACYAKEETMNSQHDTHTQTVSEKSQTTSSLISPSRTLGTFLASERERQNEKEKASEDSTAANNNNIRHNHGESAKTSSAHGSDADAPLVVLLVDDSPAILKMTSMMLRKLGHEVLTAENGAVAVKLVEERWEEQLSVFDVVLMDLQMPVMDGLEATARIRESEGDGQQLVLKPRQTIVGMSANSDEETMQQAYAAGMDTFIPKPFRADALRVVLNRTLSDHQSVHNHAL